MGNLDVPISYLREFLDLTRTLSYTETARRMQLSQPSLSRHISLIEKQLGFTLFERSTNSVSLTECGHLFADGAAKALIAIDSASHDAMKANKMPARKVIVGGGLRVPRMRNMIFAARKRLSNDEQRFLIELFAPHTSGNLIELAKLSYYDALDKGHIDAALGLIAPDVKDGYAYHPLYDVPMVFLAPKTSPLLNRTDLTLGDMKDFIFVFPAAFDELIGLFRYICREAGFEPNIELRYVINTGDSFVSHRSDDIFITFNNWFSEDTYIEFDDLERLSVNVDDATWRSGVIYREDNRNPALMPFIDALLQVVSERND